MTQAFASSDGFGGITISAACLAEEEADRPPRQLIDGNRRGGRLLSSPPASVSTLETTRKRKRSSMRAAIGLQCCCCCFCCGESSRLFVHQYNACLKFSKGIANEWLSLVAFRESGRECRLPLRIITPAHSSGVIGRENVETIGEI